jgi:hypothetical protein
MQQRSDTTRYARRLLWKQLVRGKPLDGCPAAAAAGKTLSEGFPTAAAAGETILRGFPQRSVRGRPS